MDIVVATSRVPSGTPDERRVEEALVTALRSQGHAVDTVALPFWPDEERTLEQIVAHRLVRVDDCHLVIALRPPAHLLRHFRKVIWLTADDWGHEKLAGRQPGDEVRSAIEEADGLAIVEATKVFAASIALSDRLRRRFGIGAEVLYPFAGGSEADARPSTGDYVLCSVDSQTSDRLAMAREALSRTPNGLRLVVLESTPSAGARALASETTDGSRRVSIVHEPTEEEERALVAGALCCLELRREASLVGEFLGKGAVASKTLVACSDAGAPLELVLDGETGFVVAPDVAELAAVFGRLSQEPELAHRLGAAAKTRFAQMVSPWDVVIDRLLP